MALQLIGDRVLLRPRAKTEVTAGGIILGENVGDKPQEAQVIAVGPGSKDYTMTVKVGDQIMHGKYAGTEIEIGDETLLIMPESDVLVVLGDNDE